MKATLPKVTFIIPTLNAEPFIKRCLSAIRNQDYPKDKIEIIVADAGSTDKTKAICDQFNAIIIDNPYILHEPGKTHASKEAKGELLFYIDADNILAHDQWLASMVKPYLEQKNILGLLPQTQPPPDSSPINRYLGYLFTDPFTWFVYGVSANPSDYEKQYQPELKTKEYIIYKFNAANHPLFGLSQGVGVSRNFERGGMGTADDILSGIQIIEQGGNIAYVPSAGVYHYHVTDLENFKNKYRWRIRNNLNQRVKGMGFVNRLQFFSLTRKARAILFVPYSLTLVGPSLHALLLSLKWHDMVMFWHVPACFTLGWIMLVESLKKGLGIKAPIGTYGK